MDCLTFTVEISRALAWPVAFLIALFLFRRPFSQLFAGFADNPYLRAKWGEKELELGSQAAKKMSETIPTSLGEHRFVEAISEAQVSPKVAIAEAWRDVEESAGASLAISTSTSGCDVKTALESAKLLDNDKFRLFTELQQLRNKAVRLPESAISTGTAVNYAEAAHKLAEYIRTKTKTP